ncbi:MAG: LuxR C-terminal-related transcriptional regulator [Firmicutes bacterium]|nr:LuxR C-terminal-related transcriptional regulator [Bacillota bacterium]
MIEINENNENLKDKRIEISEFINDPPFEKRSLPKEILTKKEKIIANYLLLGKCRSEIANALSVSENTIKTHTKNIFRKTKAKNQKVFMIMYFIE